MCKRMTFVPAFGPVIPGRKFLKVPASKAWKSLYRQLIRFSHSEQRYFHAFSLFSTLASYRVSPFLLPSCYRNKKKMHRDIVTTNDILSNNITFTKLLHTVKFIMLNYIQFEIFLIISISHHCSYQCMSLN